MSSLPGQTSPRVPWWYPTPRKLALLSLALVVIGVVAWGVWRATHCAPGVRRLGGQCVGVTGGGFVFTPELAPVMQRIREENRWVQAQKGRPLCQHRLPGVAPHAGQRPVRGVAPRAAGAHLAQRRANHTGELGFARVGFTNRDQVKAAVASLKRDPGARRALLIQDTNPADPFSRTLAEAFAAEFPDAEHALIEPAERDNSAFGGVGTRLVQVISS